jgi:hypothetical protein
MKSYRKIGKRNTCISQAPGPCLPIPNKFNHSGGLPREGFCPCHYCPDAVSYRLKKSY